MDPLAGLLDGPRARGAFLLRMVMDPPWSVRIEDRAPLCVMTVARGEAWVVPDRGEASPVSRRGATLSKGRARGGPEERGAEHGRPSTGAEAPRRRTGPEKAVRLGPGDVAVVRGPDPYTVAGDPATEPQAWILPGEVCRTAEGADLAERMALGVRTWGNSEHGAATMLVGTYRMDGEISRRLLDALPPLLVLGRERYDSPLLPWLGEEIVREEAGQTAVLDRLLDLLLISVLRAWFARPEARAPAWYRALGDPVVGRALRLLQNNPGHPWTVALLAAETGISRAVLARRFTELVGEPPMAYLTGWRLDLAADLLREPDATLGAVARRVGYGSPFALSAAFKRVRGVSPREHRSAASAG